MKEFSKLDKGTKGAFLTLAKAQGILGTTSLAMFSGNTGAMVPGHVGTVTDIDYREVPKGAAPPLTADQIITIGKEQVLLAKKGEQPWALSLIFDTGRTMTIGLLLQGQGKSNIKFLGDTDATLSTDLNLEIMEDKMLGKKFRCTKFFRDRANEIIRSDADGNQLPAKPANCYEFVQEA